MELYSFVSAINQQSSKNLLLKVSWRLIILLVLLSFVGLVFLIFFKVLCQYITHKRSCCRLDDSMGHSWKRHALQAISLP